MVSGPVSLELPRSSPESERLVGKLHEKAGGRSAVDADHEFSGLGHGHICMKERQGAMSCAVNVPKSLKRGWALLAHDSSGGSC